MLKVMIDQVLLQKSLTDQVTCAQRSLQAAQRYQDNKMLLRQCIGERGFHGDFFETFAIDPQDPVI